MNTAKENPPLRVAVGNREQHNYKKYRAGKNYFNENTLPNNELAEISLIENLLFRPGKVGLAKSIVTPSGFYSMMRSKVYRRIIEIDEAGRAWNWVTLENSFRNDPYFIKYQEFFDELLPWTGEMVIHNAEIIKKCADERKLVGATYQAITDLFNAVGVDAVRANLEQALKEVA